MGNTEKITGIVQFNSENFQNMKFFVEKHLAATEKPFVDVKRQRMVIECLDQNSANWI